MKRLFVVTLILSSVAFAKVYKVESKIQFSSQSENASITTESYSNTIIIEAGKKAVIRTINGQKGYHAEVLVTPLVSNSKSEQLQVNYQISKIENGKLREMGHPQIAVMPGSEASIEVGDKGKVPFMKVATVVTKQD